MLLGKLILIVSPKLWNTWNMPRSLMLQTLGLPSLFSLLRMTLLMDMIERVCNVAVFVAPEKMDSIFVIAEEWNFLFACN